MPIIIIILPP